MTTLGFKTISREQFMEVCPEVLKKRIDDFFIYYSEKKKNPFISSSDTSKKFHSNDKFEPRKKKTGTCFRKPFENNASELEKFYIDYRGVLSKVNENNQDAIWKEIQDLQLEKYISDISTVQKEISNILYQYIRNCNMYLKEYIHIINKMKKSKELQHYSNEFISLVLNDLDNPKIDDKQYNILTHNILCECTNTNLITKKKFIKTGLQDLHMKILKNLEEEEDYQENIDILIQNMRRIGKQIYKQNEVSKIIDELTQWKNKKFFNGRIHFNLIDLIDEIGKWNCQ